MATIVRGGSTELLEVVKDQRDLLLENVLELKVIALHLAEIAGVTFDQEDVELETE